MDCPCPEYAKCKRVNMIPFCECKEDAPPGVIDCLGGTFTAGKPNYEWPDEAFPYGPNPHRLFRITTTEAPVPSEWQMFIDKYYLEYILLVILILLLAICLGFVTNFSYKIIEDWCRKYRAREARKAERARLNDPANFHLRSNAWN